MSRYSLSHLSDPVLDRDLARAVARESTSTADVLAHIAESDARRRYLPAGYPSTFAYCVGQLRLSEDAAFKRIKAARAARRFPAIFEALAQGRLHLSAVVLLAPYLTEDTAGELLAAATHQTKAEIERLLAERFPRTDMLAWVESIPTSSGTRSAGQQAPGPVEDRFAPERVEQAWELAPAHVGDRSRMKPLSAQSLAVQFTLSKRGHDQLRYAQELLGHQIPSGDLAAVFERALDALIPQLERHKFAATTRPQTGGRRSTRSTRHIPAHVKRTVWARDAGQCTFFSETGQRCPARTRLEFDHIEEFARGGDATVSGIRLRCRAHNQYGAECTFGAEFMRHKRIAAAEARATAKVQASVAHLQARGGEQTAAVEQARELDVVPWLRRLGFGASEALGAAALCEDMTDASLEERVRIALSYFHPRGTRVVQGTSRDGGGSRPFGPVGGPGLGVWHAPESPGTG